jgi:hypothetical protein
MNKLQPIIDKYEEKCAEPSDINELLPYLKQFAESCEHITEMGVRNPTSTYAFLATNPKRLVSYDISRHPEVDQVERLAKAAGIDFKFRLKNVLRANIEETDMCLIDTFHSAEQCKRELERHAHKVRKYIAFHDCTTFWEDAEPPYKKIKSKLVTKLGLRYAIEPFLAAHPEWRIAFRTAINNGLLIIERS